MCKIQRWTGTCLQKRSWLSERAAVNVWSTLSKHFMDNLTGNSELFINSGVFGSRRGQGTKGLKSSGNLCLLPRMHLHWLVIQWWRVGGSMTAQKCTGLVPSVLFDVTAVPLVICWLGIIRILKAAPSLRENFVSISRIIRDNFFSKSMKTHRRCVFASYWRKLQLKFQVWRVSDLSKVAL